MVVRTSGYAAFADVEALKDVSYAEVVRIEEKQAAGEELTEAEQTICDAYNAEENLNVMRNNLRDEEIENIDRNSDNYVTGVYFMDLINELEKMGDFIINVSQDLLKYKLKVTKL